MLRIQTLRAFPVVLRENEFRFCKFDIGFGAQDRGVCFELLRLRGTHLRIVNKIVDPGKHHAFLHRGTVINRLPVRILLEHRDFAADLRTDIHKFFRLNCSGCAD